MSINATVRPNGHTRTECTFATQKAHPRQCESHRCLKDGTIYFEFKNLGAHEARQGHSTHRVHYTHTIPAPYTPLPC